MSDLREQARLVWEQRKSLKNLEEKLEQDLIFAYNGGLWKASPELISFLAAIKEYDPKVVKDINNIPVEVVASELFEIAIEKYTYATNAWATEYKRLSKIRTVKGLKNE